MSESFRKKYGSWALITGAARSSGLGYAFAQQLAEIGFNIVLVDILVPELQARATELREQHKIEARPIPLDLGRSDFMTALAEQTADIEVGFLVCNHMYTPKDTPKILDLDLAVHHQMLDINARAYTTLMHTYGRQMRERNKGAIVVVSSGSGIVHAPYVGAYAANKSFQIALGEILWYELKETGVDVLTLAAGLMDTQGDALSKYPQAMISKTADVVEETLANLGKRPLLVPGMINKLFMFMQTKLMSRERTLNSIGKFMEDGLGK